MCPRTSLWALDCWSLVDFLAENSRPMPIIGVRARRWQNRPMIALFCPQPFLPQPGGENQRGVGVSGILGLPGENADLPKGWPVPGVGRFGTPQQPSPRPRRSVLAEGRLV